MADPFADRNANPFADPSVQGALGSSRPYDDHGADEYPSTGGGGWGSGAHAAPSKGLSDDPYDANSLEYEISGTPTPGAAAAAAAGAGATSREEELARRERELADRERELASRAEHIQKHGRNNWPFFYPIIYHDITAEIPPTYQTVVTHLYWLWLTFAGTLVLNLVACVFLLVQGSSDGIKDLVAGIVYFPVFTLGSFMLWYRPVYNGFMKEHSLFYYVYFLFGGCHLALSVYLFLGIPSTGSDGLLNMIQSWSSGRHVAAILGVFVTLGFAVQGLGNLWYYRQIWRHNHDQGHTFAQAKAELASHGAKAYFTRGSQV